MEKKVPKKFIGFVLIALMTVSCYISFNGILLPEGGEVYGAKGKSIKEPELASEGAVVYCENTGNILFEKNGSKAYEPFSTIKLLTAIIALERIPLTREITVSEDAVKQGDSSAGLKAGEVTKVKDLLYNSLIVSGNDSAYALAQAVDTDIKAYLKIMNGVAAELGCKNSNFTNPNGISDKSQYTSAYDLMLIGRRAFSNPEILKACSGEKFTISGTNMNAAHEIRQKMALIEENTGIVAQKTGSWGNTGTSVAKYDKNGLKLIIAVLNCPKDKRNDDIKKLISYSEKQLDSVRVIKAGSEVGKVTVSRGAKRKIAVFTKHDGLVYLPLNGSKSLIKTNVSLKSLKAPVKDGDVVGSYDIYVAGELTNQVPLIIKESVSVGWFTSYLGLSNFSAVILGVVIFIVIAFVIYVRQKKKSIAKKKEYLRKKKIRELAQKMLEEEENRKRRNWDV